MFEILFIIFCKINPELPFLKSTLYLSLNRSLYFLSFIEANFVTYSNEAKVKYLSVNEKTLEEFGAVSAQTVREMACGLMNNTSCDVALATTGIAGPTGGSVEKPIGTVFVGVKIKDKLFVERFNLNPKYSRTRMKRKFTKQAFEFLLEQLTKF